jgi:hypothetical protein
MSEVKNKEEYYQLYNLGYFGNRALTWNSYDEIIQSGWSGLVCIRGKGIPRADAKFNVAVENLRAEIEALKSKGISEDRLRFNQSMPDYALSIQGEVIDYTNRFLHINGWELTYTTVKKPMNEGLREETRFASGLPARMILQSRMDPSSFSDLQTLLEIYPSAAVEFSTYELNVGDTPNRNTVFWEVRDY